MTDEKSMYVEVYSEKDYLKDEKSFSEAEKESKLDLTSFRRLMMHDLAVNTDIIETGCIGNVSMKDIDFALRHPQRGWGILLRASEQLMMNSPHYYRLNSLYSNMALFLWGIDLYDVKESANVKTIKQVYTKLSSKLEEMHLKHEFSKIMKCLPYQDIYCGLVVENDTDFFFQKIDYRICRLYQVQDGLYNFQINLSAINEKELGGYPDYVQDAYIKYRDNGKIGFNWYLPPADKQICIKWNSQLTTPYPPLIGLVRDILDLDTYKKLKLQSARTDNYKAIMIKVPIDTTTVDKPLLTPQTLGVFAEINRESMSDDIGMIHVLGDDGEAISFKDSTNTTNNVSDAVTEIYNDAGVPQELFNSSGNATSMTLATENASGFVYGIYRQLERWVNRYIKLRKFNRSAFKFYFYLLDATIFNRDTVAKRYKESASMGIAIEKYLASLDMTPSRVLGSYILSKDIFNFHSNFIPLQSSYNTPVATEGGRPQAEVGDLSDSGEDTREKEKNDR